MPPSPKPRAVLDLEARLCQVTGTDFETSMCVHRAILRRTKLPLPHCPVPATESGLQVPQPHSVMLVVPEKATGAQELGSKVIQYDNWV